MRGGIIVLALSAVLSGCSGAGGTARGPVSRATLHATDTEEFHHCPPVTTERLARRADIAFSGVLSIEGVDGTRWVIDVDHWYTGGDEDVMVVAAGSPSIDYFAQTVGSERDGRLYGPIDWPQDGDRLLVAASGLTRRDQADATYVGFALGCLTQAWTTDLAERFERAFATRSPRPRPR
jgi:hypothetical protein